MNDSDAEENTRIKSRTDEEVSHLDDIDTIIVVSGFSNVNDFIGNAGSQVKIWKIKPKNGE